MAMQSYPPSLSGLDSAKMQGTDSTVPSTQGAQPQAAPQPDPKDVDPNDPDYEPPASGPFECDNCSYYQDPNQCTQPAVMAKQGGKVEAQGCCKFFTSAAGATAGAPSSQSRGMASVPGKEAV